MSVRNLLNVVITSVLIAFSTQALSATEVVLSITAPVPIYYP